MVNHARTLTGTRAIVTGATGGMGAAIVDSLVARGASVTGVDISVSSDDRRVEPDMVRYIQCDVRDPAAIERTVSEHMERHGRIDILVNAAGVELAGRYSDVEVAQWDDVMEINLRAPWLFCKHVGPEMAHAGSGSIVNVGSVSGVQSSSMSVAYASSKAGLHMFTRQLARELAPDGVRVNAVVPGTILTPMVTRWTTTRRDPAEAMRRLRSAVPLGRIGDVQDVAKAVLYLASADSAYCTGTVLRVDGGLTA